MGTMAYKKFDVFCICYAISYRSLLTQKIQEGLDAAAQLLYLSGSYALQVGDIVEIAVLGRLGQHTGITAEDGIRDADKLIAPEAAILGSKAKTVKQSIDIVAFAGGADLQIFCIGCGAQRHFRRTEGFCHRNDRFNTVNAVLLQDVLQAGGLTLL